MLKEQIAVFKTNLKTKLASVEMPEEKLSNPINNENSPSNSKYSKLSHR